MSNSIQYSIDTNYKLVSAAGKNYTFQNIGNNKIEYVIQSTEPIASVKGHILNVSQNSISVYADSDIYARVKTGVGLLIVSINNSTIQKKTTPLVIGQLNKITNSTTTSAIALQDTYDITFTSVVGVSVGSYIRLFSLNTQRFYVGFVIGINGNVITMDRLLDSEFENGAIIDIAITNMNVDGSVTPQIFSIRGGSSPEELKVSVDIARLMFGCATVGAVDLAKFGDQPALTRGLLIRQTDGMTYNIFNVKTNGELATLMFDWDPHSTVNPQQGQNGFLGRFSLTKLESVLRLRPNEDVQVVVQDDLRLITRLEVVAEGDVS